MFLHNLLLPLAHSLRTRGAPRHLTLELSRAKSWASA